MIIFESSPLWLIVCLLAAILSTCILYLRKSNECVSKRLKIVLMLLRGAAMFLLFALLLDIFIVNEHSSTEKPLIVCAADNSASMIAAADSSEVKSLFANYDNKIDKLQKKFTVKSLLFGSKITEDITTPDFKDNATDISSSILYANSLFGKNSIDAMLIVSDGIITDGFDLDITAQKNTIPYLYNRYRRYFSSSRLRNNKNQIQRHSLYAGQLRFRGEYQSCRLQQREIDPANL